MDTKRQILRLFMLEAKMCVGDTVSWTNCMAGVGLDKLSGITVP